LLSFIDGATETTIGPEVAPVGIVTVIELAVQKLTVTAALLRKTVLAPCEAPNPEPDITNSVPTDPVVADMLEITGAGDDAELIDTLSKVAVTRLALL
jgi:hypothetical protein